MNQERLDNALNYLFDQGVSTGAIAHNPFISMSKYDSDNLINPMRMTMVDCAKFEIIRLFEIENHINKCINNSNNKAPEIY